MKAAKRPVAAFLVLAGICVGLNLILTPVYHDGSEGYPVWRVLNWFMAAGTLIVLAVNCLRKRAIETGEVSTIEYLRTSAAYYGSIVLAILFFWEWFWTLNPDSETGLAVTAHMMYFPIMDSLFTVVALATGCHLWREGARTPRP